jgi:predicted Zn-dependent protease
MHFSLASIYVRLDRMAEAKKELGRALQLKPAHYDANLMLDQILVAQKNATAALPYLQRAAHIQPGAPAPHGLLAEASGPVIDWCCAV